MANNQTSNSQKDANMSYWDEKMRLRWKGLKIPPFIGKGPPSNNTKRAECKWLPPKARWIKLNFDGPSRGNSGDVGLGYCLHNSKGEELAHMAIPMGKSTNNEAELNALVEGINLCKILNVKTINIEGDSSIIINALRKGVMPDWKLNASLTEILTDIRTFDRVIYNHIYIEGNKRDDYLANMGADGKTVIHVAPGIYP
ncbi:uncharacterized protein LOC131875851 [Cryptomeria japonica]|uniref:uncharacterized protein LOC131875851 n=1 Tax=Cryptomeria japonica TaxID=3369 RepID=UPI0027DA9663|nr:uncharacterized protein LOC131875851 [Cryptomeria japonica]